jgi:hypothetical protein
VFLLLRRVSGKGVGFESETHLKGFLAIVVEAERAVNVAVDDGQELSERAESFLRHFKLEDDAMQRRLEPRF